MSAVRIEKGVAGARPGVCRVWLPDLGNRRNDFPGYADSISSVVSRHVVGYDAEEWRQRVGSATGAGPQKLRDSLDFDA